MQGELVKNAKIVFVSAPKDYDASAITNEFICMKNYQRVCFIIQTGAWAGGTAAVTLAQATSDGGTTAALGFTKMYTNIASTSSDTLVETTVSSNTFDIPATAVSALYCIEVTSDMLDVDSGYDWVVLGVAQPSGSNADFYSVTAIAYNGPKGASAPSAVA